MTSKPLSKIQSEIMVSEIMVLLNKALSKAKPPKKSKAKTATKAPGSSPIKDNKRKRSSDVDSSDDDDIDDDSGGVYACGICHKVGHNKTTCPNPENKKAKDKKDKKVKKAKVKIIDVESESESDASSDASSVSEEPKKKKAKRVVVCSHCGLEGHNSQGCFDRKHKERLAKKGERC